MSKIIDICMQSEKKAVVLFQHKYYYWFSYWTIHDRYKVSVIFWQNPCDQVSTEIIDYVQGYN